MHNCAKPRVLICCPRLDIQGGVSNYYRVVKSRLSSQKDISFLEIGGNSRSKLGILWAAIAEPLYFVKNVISSRAEIVHLNPSLQPNSVLRTAIFVILGKLLGRKIVVFWRGWNMATEKTIREHFNKLFCLIFNSADLTLVLAQEFRKKLYAMGFSHPILVTTTIYDDIKVMDRESNSDQVNHSVSQPSLFFMSRIVEDKGIRQCLEAFVLLKQSIPDLIFNVAGDGPLLDDLIKEYGAIDRINFLGNVADDGKYEALHSSDIFLFPSTYGEGMPNAVLEAMACGCSVIATHTGALADFFKDEIHGLVVTGQDTRQLAIAIKRLVDNEALREKTGENNALFAMKYFSASVVTEYLINVYKAVYIDEIYGLPTSWYAAENE